MSNSDVSLFLTCDNAAAELLVVDNEFKVVAKGSTPLTTNVVPGIYALKAKIGEHLSERIEAIDGSEPSHSYHLAAPEFESPMPLSNTTTSREYHAGSLHEFTELGRPFVALGVGSAVILYVRDTSRTNFDLKPEQQKEYAKNFQGFRLLDTDDKELVNFDDKATKQIDQGYIGAQVRLNPGHYVLAWKHGNQDTCLALNTAPGWGLQVFIRLQPLQANSLRMLPDFSQVAFAYDRVDATYLTGREDFRAMEAARLALLDRRDVVSGQMLRSMLTGKYDNPMLGVYGGHLLAATSKVDLDLLGQVILNTSAMLGKDNPDIVALAWAYESFNHARLAGFDARPWSEILASLKGPPLLVQSWDALINCAQAAQVDIDTLPAFRIAGELAVSGIVVTWEHREAKHVAKRDVATEPPLYQQQQQQQQQEPQEPQQQWQQQQQQQEWQRAHSTVDRVAQGAHETVDRLAAKAAPMLDRARSAATHTQQYPSTQGSSDSTLPSEHVQPSGIIAKWGKAIWEAVASRLLSKTADGIEAPLPMLEVNVAEITTFKAAADAMRLLTKKAAWDQWLRLTYKDRDKADSLATFSPLQRDLISTLARARVEPESADGIDDDYIKSILHAHRVPLSTLASALRALDVVAVSFDVIGRLKVALTSVPKQGAIQ